MSSGTTTIGGNMSTERTPTPREPGYWLLTAPEAAEIVRGALAAGDEPSAVRWLTEFVGLIRNFEGHVPGRVLAEPRSTGDQRYDILLAVALRHFMEQRGEMAPVWALRTESLESEWLFGGDGHESDAFRDLIRRDSQAAFLAAGILVREKDLGIA